LLYPVGYRRGEVTLATHAAGFTPRVALGGEMDKRRLAEGGLGIALMPALA
jgi:hypothetical protein